MNPYTREDVGASVARLIAGNLLHIHELEDRLERLEAEIAHLPGRSQ